ncbi:MAG: MerR family transcriptional regulator [Bacteroidales bacterium]|nr:MerR family transcriptional regulator [Bacteroidales bacterium]
MEEGLNTFTIKDLENFSGIKAHTIRIWEKRYRVLEPDRTDSNIRLYNESELKKLLNIAYLNRNGFKISKIALLSDDELSRQVMSVSSMDDELYKGIHPGKILMSAIKFNEHQFMNELVPFIKNYGVEEAYVRVFSPLLEKAKILWQTGSLSRAQEQFIKYIIREIMTIENNRLKVESGKLKATVAMINTTDNHSGIHFLFYKYVLTRNRYDVLYTGGILPASEVIELYKIKPFEYLVVNSGSFDLENKKISYFSSIGKSLLIKKVIMTDYPSSTEKKIPDNIILLRTPGDFLNVIPSLHR